MPAALVPVPGRAASHHWHIRYLPACLPAWLGQALPSDQAIVLPTCPTATRLNYVQADANMLRPPFQKFVCLIPSNTTVQKRSFVPIVNLSYLDPAATAALRKELVLEAAALENIEVGWSHKKPEDQ